MPVKENSGKIAGESSRSVADNLSTQGSSLPAVPAFAGGGLPATLKSGIENLSGVAMDDVKVHYNSSQPAQLRALAYAQGNNIHIAPGQERHLPHEAWHVVQQKQGRVRPTIQAKMTIQATRDLPINDDPILEREADTMGARALRSGIPTTPVTPAAAPIASNEPIASAAPDLDDRIAVPVIQGVFTYTASVILDRKGAVHNEAKEYSVGSINLPATARPPTQFGNAQMAHSVSWTLLKSSYEAARDIRLDTFVNDYLKKDWQELAKQAKLGTRKEAVDLLQTYLTKYNDGFFDNLKTDKRSFLQWHGTIQTAVTDYFVALQLAPLSTHTGFTQHIGKLGKGIKESNPSGHGEPAANTFFQDLENVKGGTGADKTAVVEHARAFWDPGIGMVGGINESDRIELLLDEYTRSFMRAYPKTWTTYGAVINTELIAKAREEVKPYSGKGHTKEGKVSKSDADDEAETNSGGFQAAISLLENGGSGGTATADKFEISQYDIKEIALPDDRPQTKYGPAGQKSHTVSWTLVLGHLRSLGKEKQLQKFLIGILLKWMSLEDQDWESMISSNLITSKDFPRSTTHQLELVNKANAERLSALEAMIKPNTGKLQKAIGGEPKKDLDWSTFVQQTVAEYVLVYQSSPLSAYRDGMAKGRGEPDANNWLGNLHSNPALIDTEGWKRKFVSELFEKSNTVTSAWKGDKNLLDRDEALAIARKVKAEKELDKKEKDRLCHILVKQLAKKYLDVAWSAAGQGNSPTLGYAPPQLARILVEWEESLKSVYPEIWKIYGPTLEAYSEDVALTPGLISEQKGTDQSKETLKTWVREERSTREDRRKKLTAT